MPGCCSKSGDRVEQQGSSPSKLPKPILSVLHIFFSSADTNRRIQKRFVKGSLDVFSLVSPCELGALTKLQLEHSAIGAAGWFVEFVTITVADTKYRFPCVYPTFSADIF